MRTDQRLPLVLRPDERLLTAEEALRLGTEASDAVPVDLDAFGRSRRWTFTPKVRA